MDSNHRLPGFTYYPKVACNFSSVHNTRALTTELPARFNVKNVLQRYEIFTEISNTFAIFLSIHQDSNLNAPLVCKRTPRCYFQFPYRANLTGNGVDSGCQINSHPMGTLVKAWLFRHGLPYFKERQLIVPCRVDDRTC